MMHRPLNCLPPQRRKSDVALCDCGLESRIFGTEGGGQVSEGRNENLQRSPSNMKVYSTPR